MVCAPPSFVPTMANPFQLWQDMVKAWQPQPAPQPVAANPLQAMQNQFQQGMAQNIAMWQNMLMPQATVPQQPTLMAPKITVTTIELGDIRPYMAMATQMMTALQPMMQAFVMGGRR